MADEWGGKKTGKQRIWRKKRKNKRRRQGSEGCPEFKIRGLSLRPVSYLAAATCVGCELCMTLGINQKPGPVRHLFLDANAVAATGPLADK